MPLSYSGIIAEHRAVRERVGLFDVSHLGKVWIGGPGAVEALDSLLAGKVASLKEGRAGYNLLLNESGGIVDDLFVYRYPHGLLVVPNAANTEKVIGILTEALESKGDVRDARLEWAIVALSGPASRSLLEGGLARCRELKLHEFVELEYGGSRVMVARTGYTGELTFEFFVPWSDAPRVWSALLEEGEPLGIIPTGLGARDTLRLEMGYPLHGSDISEETNPLEAGLGWVINWSKEFRGKRQLERIKAKGLDRALAGLEGRGGQIPRKGYLIYREDELVGQVTSGNFSPVLGKGIALAYLAPSAARPGTEVWVDVRGKRLEAEVVNPPFIRR